MRREEPRNAAAVIAEDGAMVGLAAASVTEASVEVAVGRVVWRKKCGMRDLDEGGMGYVMPCQTSCELPQMRLQT
jgi:hypothetical protein